MRAMIWGITLAAVIGLAQYGLGTTYPDQPTRDMQSMTATELEKAADAYCAQKDYEHAVEYFREALRKDKNNAVLYNKLGMAELKTGNLRDSRIHFEKATKLNKNYPNAFNNLGVVYYAENNFNQAAKYFKKALALEETRAAFHVNLGVVWFSQKQLDRAIAEYSRALELDPGVLLQSSQFGVAAQLASPEEQASFYYLLAKIQAQRGDMEECLVCLKKAKESGHRNLSNVYKDQAFSPLWNDARLAEIVSPPVVK